MSGDDTQLPRYEVFLQEKTKQSFKAVGSIHAADAEMALFNARSVFVRRPHCAGLWVAPAKAIIKATAEELMSEDFAPSEKDAGIPRRYRVFQKRGQRRSMTYVEHVGQIDAGNVAEAWRLSLEKFPTNDTFVWWLCPDDAFAESEENVQESWFDPAQDKIYKQQNQYQSVGGHK